MNRLTLMIASALSLFVLGMGTSRLDAQIDESNRKVHRQIYVPFESLDVLLDGNSNRVLLDRQEYEQLVQSARTQEIVRAPFDSAIVSATYVGKVLQGVAHIRGELVIEPLNQGLVQIPLPFRGVAIRSAEWDSRPANLWRNEKGEIVLLTSNTSRQKLIVEMTVPMETTAARQSMAIGLPSPSATKFSLTVPGNVEVKSGASVIARSYDEDANTTAFELLPVRGQMNIVMSLNNRLLKDDQVVVSRSVMIHKLTPDVQEMHVTCSLDVIHGALEQIEFTIPDGFEVSHVSSKWLSQWEIAESPDNSTRLVVKFRQAMREDIVLNITAVRNEGVVGQWQSQDIRPVDVAGHVSVVGILADVGLASSGLVSDGVIPIDQAFLLAAIPDSIKKVETENRVRVVAAYYAPQRDYSISARFVVPPPELIVHSNSRLLIGDQKLQLQGGMSLISRYDARFEIKIFLPASWRLDEMTDINNQPLQYDRLENSDDSGYLIHLPTMIPSASSMKIFFKASMTPDGWLEQWSSNTVDFPAVTVVDQTKHTGTVAVALENDLAAKPTETNGLELMDTGSKSKFQLDTQDASVASLAYQFKESGYGLKLDLDRITPTINARTYSFYSIGPNGLGVHAELVYDIQQAREYEFKFELPLQTPKSISIRCQGRRLKDYSSVETETARQWTVQLADPTKDAVHLLVDFQMPMAESDLAELKLGPVVVQGVSFQSSMMVIEGSNELDIEIATDARSVDVNELSETVYQPGRYMLGAYAWPNERMELTVTSSRRPIYQLPSAIVQRAEIVTAISTRGVAQTAARFQLVVKQQPFLRIELPQDANLWSVLLDGKPAKPQSRGDALLISLIGNENGKLRDLQIVFESPSAAFGLVGQVQAQAPSLWLNDTLDGVGVPVPMVDLNWRLVIPKGFSVTRSNGEFQSDQIVGRASPIEQLGDWIYWLGGGVDFPQTSRFMVMEKNVRLMQPSIESRNYIETEPSLLIDLSESMSDPNDKSDKDQTLLLRGERSDVARKPLEPGEGSALFAARGAIDSTPSSPDSDLDLLFLEGQANRPVSGQVPWSGGKLWALSGLRSLNIELTETGNSVEFSNLGENQVLSATLVDQTKMNWISLAFSFLIAAMGVLLTHRSVKPKIRYLILVLAAACLVPLAGSGADNFRSIVDAVMMAAVLLAVYFVVAASFKILFQTFGLMANRMTLALFLFGALTAMASPSYAQQVVNNADDIKHLIEQLQSVPKVQLPDDAIIIPFDAGEPDGRENANRLLVPYDHYVELMRRVEQGKPGDSIEGPVRYVVSAAQYELGLSIDDDVSINGTLVIELFTDQATTIPLAFRGGALSNATVDGEPAKLMFSSIDENSQTDMGRGNSPEQNSRQSERIDNTMVQLYLEGRGKRVFRFVVQMRPERQGGWRMLNARLPIGVTRGLKLKSLNESTEIRLNSDADHRTLLAKPDQRIESVLNADGSLRLQWRPSSATQVVDQSLTAESEAVFDVREDGLRLTWQVKLDFRGAERDTFTLNLPDDYLVEDVLGDNIRAWDVVQADGGKRLDVTLLGTAKNSETFSVELSRRDFSLEEQVTQFDAPYLSVAGAALHRGVYSIRRSPIIEIKTARLSGASRIDGEQSLKQISATPASSDASPLGIETFQVMRFVTTPFEISLQANLVPQTIKAETQTIFRIGQSEADMEMKIKIDVGKRPIYKLSLELPRQLSLNSLNANLNESWNSEDTGENQRIDIFFPSGVDHDFSVLIAAGLPQFLGGNEWTLPGVTIEGASEQKGQIAIQVDPSVSVTATDLRNCEVVLLRRIESWLNPGQRAMTRLAMDCNGSDFAATLRFTKIEPRVTVETVTNVRTTLFSVEETLLLDFNIQQAGIGELQFEMPAAMRNARINAKLISEILVEDVSDDSSIVRVTLKLQDDVIDAYRVVVEFDRAISDDRQDIPIPRVLTGVTEHQYVTLQNTGRDEIDVLPSTGFQKLNRQLNEFGRLKQKLNGGELTLAFVAIPEVTDPVLQFDTHQREVFDTVAASIEFSKTTMVVDSGGAYRALQSFQVNNRSEQYLEIELPAGARLLTVMVENEPVKPVAWPAAQNERRLRIPLVKNSVGDLDYPVQLIYAGRLGDLSRWEEIEFPVVETLNINVQLSQLHLRLPESYRWMNFGGTMTKVDDQGELEAGYLSYKSRQIQQLIEEMQTQFKDSGDGEYSYFSKVQSRAYDNLQQLEEEMKSIETAQSQTELRFNSRIEDLIVGNKQAIQQAQQEFAGESQKVLEIDNRTNFNDLVEDQTARIANNLVNRQDLNFKADIPTTDLALEINKNVSGRLDDGKRSGMESKKSFDNEWFARNQLGKRGKSKLGMVDSDENGSGGGGGLGPPAEVGLKTGESQGIADAPARFVDESVQYSNPLVANSRNRTSQRMIDRAEENLEQHMTKLRGKAFIDGMYSELSVAEKDATAGFQIDNEELPSVPGNQAGSPTNRGPNATTGMTSLEIEIPERGVDFFFKSPRGNASVTVRPIATDSISRWISAATGLGLCMLAWIVFRVVVRLGQSTTLRYIGVAWLLLAGLLSVGANCLPVYGMLAIIASIVWLFSSLMKRLLKQDESMAS